MSSNCSHDNERVVGQCNQCSTSICPDCLKEFGYFCSLICKTTYLSKNKSLFTDEEKKEQQVLAQKSQKWAHWILWKIPFLIILGFSFYYTLEYFSPAGKTVWKYSLETVPITMNFQKPWVSVLTQSNVSILNYLNADEIFKSPLPHQISSYEYNTLENINQQLFWANQNHLQKISMEHDLKQTFHKIKDYQFLKQLIKINHYLISIDQMEHHDWVLGTEKNKNQFKIFLTDPISEKDLWVYTDQFNNPQIKIINQDYFILYDFLPQEYELIPCPKHTIKNIFLGCKKCKTKIKNPPSFRFLIFDIHNEKPIHIKNIPLNPDQTNNEYQNVFIHNETAYIQTLDQTLIFNPLKPQLIEKMSSSENFIIKDIFQNYIVQTYQRKLELLQNENILWKINIDNDEISPFLTSTHLLYQGILTKKKSAGLTPIVSSVSSLFSTKQFTYIPSLFAYHIQTGELDWTLENVSGNYLKSNDSKIYFIDEKTTLDLNNLNQFLGQKSFLQCIDLKKRKCLWKQKINGAMIDYQYTDKGILTLRAISFIPAENIGQANQDQTEQFVLEMIHL